MVNKESRHTESRALTFTWSYWAAFVGGLAWVSYLLAHSPGAPFDDEIAHIYLSLRAWDKPEKILNVWGRPFNTLIFMPPVLLGVEAARVWALIISSVTVLFTSLWAQTSSENS